MISLQDAQDSAQSLREALDGAGLSDAVEIRKTVDENGMVRFAIDLAPGRKDRMEALLRHLGDEGAICHDLSLARSGERREGKEGGSTCRSRWTPYNSKKHHRER